MPFDQDEFNQIKPFIRTLITVVVYLKDRDDPGTCYATADEFIEELEQDCKDAGK